MEIIFKTQKYNRTIKQKTLTQKNRRADINANQKAPMFNEDGAYGGTACNLHTFVLLVAFRSDPSIAMQLLDADDALPICISVLEEGTALANSLAKEFLKHTNTSTLAIQGAVSLDIETLQTLVKDSPQLAIDFETIYSRYSN